MGNILIRKERTMETTLEGGYYVTRQLQNGRWVVVRKDPAPKKREPSGVRTRQLFGVAKAGVR